MLYLHFLDPEPDMHQNYEEYDLSGLDSSNNEKVEKTNKSLAKKVSFQDLNPARRAPSQPHLSSTSITAPPVPIRTMTPAKDKKTTFPTFSSFKSDSVEKSHQQMTGSVLERLLNDSVATEGDMNHCTQSENGQNIKSVRTEYKYFF